MDVDGNDGGVALEFSLKFSSVYGTASKGIQSFYFGSITVVKEANEVGEAPC